jgi:hypothetical protein
MENASAKKSLTLTPMPEIIMPAPRAPVVEFTRTEEESKKEGKKTENKIENVQSSMSLLETARDALVGIPADLLAGRGSLQEIFTKSNRLRGLGIILVLIAVFVAVSRLV